MSTRPRRPVAGGRLVPRGPLPPGVYWTRRILTLGVALGLVMIIATALNAVSDGSNTPRSDARAKQAGAGLSGSPTTGGKSGLTKRERRLLRQQERAAAANKPKLATPDGPCEPQDITVAPYVDQAVAWRRSAIVLELKTNESPACSWRTSPDTITVRLTGRQGEVWTSRECPRAVPTEDLVLRNDVSVKVSVTWSGRRSDSKCTGSTRWVRPGWYRVQAAAFTGEPGQLLFELQRPKPPILPKTPEPTQQPSKEPSASSSTRPAPGRGESQPTDAPTGKPSGAVEP
ncbi:MAG: hypothetical protein ACRCYU_19650 [Nocardioides sp.]